MIAKSLAILSILTDFVENFSYVSMVTTILQKKGRTLPRNQLIGTFLNLCTALHFLLLWMAAGMFHLFGGIQGPWIIAELLPRVIIESAKSGKMKMLGD